MHCIGHQDKRINLQAAFKTTPKCENTRNSVGATVPVARKCANRSSTGDRGRSPLQRYRRITRSTKLMRLSCIGHDNDEREPDAPARPTDYEDNKMKKEISDPAPLI